MTEKTKFTPGPWRMALNKWNAQPHEPWTDAIKIEGDVDAGWTVPPVICALYRGEGNNANARLIAAAPDLYEALNLFVLEIGDTRRDMLSPELLFTLDNARAALRKAVEG